MLGWNRLATLHVSKHERVQQMEDFASDLEDEVTDHLSNGLRPAEVAASILLRSGSGALGEAAEALHSHIATLGKKLLRRPTMREREMVMLIPAGVILFAGALLGVGGWYHDPSPEAGLHMFILAGIVGIAFGIGLPGAIAAGLCRRC